MNRRVFQFTLFLSALLLSSCYECKQCNMIYPADAFNWIPDEELDSLVYVSNDTSTRFFKTGENELNQTDEICGNTDQACEIELIRKIYEFDSLFENPELVGESYVFVSDDDDFTAVFNFLYQQLYQLDQDSAIKSGTGDSIIFYESIIINDSIFTNVYEALFDTSTTANDDQCVRLFYQIENGLLRFDTKSGHYWTKKLK